MTQLGPAFAPKGWTHAGPESQAFRALRGRAHVWTGAQALPSQVFSDHSAILACGEGAQRAVFPWPLMAIAPDSPAFVAQDDADRLRALHAATPLQAKDLWWCDHVDATLPAYMDHAWRTQIFHTFLVLSLAHWPDMARFTLFLHGGVTASPGVPTSPALFAINTPLNAALPPSSPLVKALDRLNDATRADRAQLRTCGWLFDGETFNRTRGDVFSMSASVTATPSAHDVLTALRGLDALLDRAYAAAGAHQPAAL